MKKLSIIILTMIALSSFMATTVQAASPHFIRGPTASLDTSSGEYCVSFKEAGLGNSPITYTLSVATETFTFQCFTRKGNTPQGDPNGVSFSDESVSETITPHNGQISGTLCLTPQQGDAACQGGGLILKLTHVTYLDVRFCDITNGICFELQDGDADVVPPLSFGGGHGH